MRSRVLGWSAALLGLVLGACHATPKSSEKEDFLDRAQSTVRQFERTVPGLTEQIKQSAGYVVFPDVSRWGVIFIGGTHGRGAVYRADGTQQGWAALNTGGLGLEAGVEGFRLLMVIQDDATMKKFMANQLTGSVAGTAVASEKGVGSTGRFQNGVVVYEGANRGLMAGVQVGLDHIKYRPTETETK